MIDNFITSFQKNNYYQILMNSERVIRFLDFHPNQGSMDKAKNFLKSFFSSKN